MSLGNTRRSPPAALLAAALAMSLLGLSGCHSSDGAKVARAILRGDDSKSHAPMSAVPPAAVEQLIDLGSALLLAGTDNPTIALADEAVRGSLAELLQARALLLPTLNAGTTFNLHRGNLQSSQGIILDVDRQSLYAGAGAVTTGTGTVAIPGVRVTANLADAIYEPVAASRQVDGRRLDATATRNAILLEVATRYLDLAGAEARLAALRQSESEAAEVVRLTTNFARTGQGRSADAERASSDALLLHTQEQRVEEEVAVAAANLARLLSVDPSVRLRAADGLPPLLRLVDPRQDVETLIRIALNNRPEIGAAAASIAVARANLRQEKVRPLLPTLSVGYSAGTFGGGSNRADSSFGHFNGRTDFDALAVWSLNNLGFGNLAEQRRWRSLVDQATAQQGWVVDQVRREVSEAHALSSARFHEVEVARRQVVIAYQGYRLDLSRIRNLEGRPIEVLNSLNLLATARQDLIRALIGYDQAQFSLFVALGQPPPPVFHPNSQCGAD